MSAAVAGSWLPEHQCSSSCFELLLWCSMIGLVVVLGGPQEC